MAAMTEEERERVRNAVASGMASQDPANFAGAPVAGRALQMGANGIADLTGIERTPLPTPQPVAASTPESEPAAAAPPPAPTAGAHPAAPPPLATASKTVTDTSQVKDNNRWQAARALADKSALDSANVASARGEEGAALAIEQGEADANSQEIAARRAEASAEQRKKYDLIREEKDKAIQAERATAVAKAQGIEDGMKSQKYPDFWADKTSGERIAARIGLLMGVVFSRGPTNQVAEAIDRDLLRDRQIWKEQQESALEKLKLAKTDVSLVDQRRKEIMDEIGIREGAALAQVSDRLDAEAARAKVPSVRIAAKKMALEYRQRSDEKLAEAKEGIAKRAEVFHATTAARVQSRTETETGGDDGRPKAEGQQITQYAANVALKARVASLTEMVKKNPEAFKEMQKKLNDFRAGESNAVGRTWRGMGKIVGASPNTAFDKMSPAARDLYTRSVELRQLYQKGADIGSSDADAQSAEDVVGFTSLDPGAFGRRLGEMANSAEARNKTLAAQRKFAGTTADGSPAGAPVQSRPASVGADPELVKLAKANPNDPRSKAYLAKYGVQ